MIYIDRQMLTKSCHTGHQKLIHRPFEECFLFWLSVSCCNVIIKDEMVSSRLAKQLKQLRTINQHSVSKTVTAQIIIASKLKITLFFCQTRNYPPLSGFISQLPLLHFCLPHYSLPSSLPTLGVLKIKRISEKENDVKCSSSVFLYCFGNVSYFCLSGNMIRFLAPTRYVRGR